MSTSGTEATRPWSLRPIRYDDDLDQITELAKVAFARGPTPYDGSLAKLNHLQWKYLENPAGKAIGVVCEVEGQLIGFNALFPLVMKIGDSPRRCAIPGDSMVHPRFQRQGIYIAMHRYLVEKAGQDISMLYAPPRSLEEPTARGALKYLQFTRVGNVRALVKSLSVSSILRNSWQYRKPTFGNLLKYFGSVGALVSISLLSEFRAVMAHVTEGGSQAPERSRGIKVHEITPLVFGSEFDELWRGVKDSFQVAVVRGEDYLNWRFSMPGETYTGLRADENGVLSGYCVLSYHESENLKVCWISDILARSPEAARSLVDAAICRARKDQAHILMMLQTKHTQRCSGRLGLGRAWGWKRVLVVLVRSPDVPQDLVHNISNWYITLGDSDWA